MIIYKEFILIFLKLSLNKDLGVGDLLEGDVGSEGWGKWDGKGGKVYRSGLLRWFLWEIGF